MTARPNVLWLVLDCARADRLSAHGYGRETTPTLDRLIREGIDYTHAVSPAIWSLPAYTALLTGLYPSQHGVNVAGDRLPAGTPTLAQQLRRAGYATACFSNNAWLSPVFGLGAGFETFDRMWFAAQETLADKAEFVLDRGLGTLRGEVDKGAKRTNRRLTDWLEAQRGTPSFAFVAYVEPHTPYTTHRRLAARWGAAAEGDAYAYDWVESLPERHEYPPERVEAASVQYDIEMRYLDGLIGDMLDDFERRGLLEDTIVVVTADHGELIGEHGMMGHQCSVAEPLRRVPLIVWAPDLVEQPRVVPDVVQTVDLAPAIAHWCGAEWEASPLNRPLPLHAGDAGREVAVTDYPRPYLDGLRGKFPDADLAPVSDPLVAASDDRYKVVRRGDDVWTGYDLLADPGESAPLAPDAAPELAALRDALVRYDAEAQTLTGDAVGIPDDVRRHLKALGYVE